MNINSGDPRDDLKKIFEKYKITPYTFSLFSGLDEKEVVEYANHETSLNYLPHSKQADINELIVLLSIGLTAVTADERVTAIIEHLNDSFKISLKTLATYAKIEEQEIKKFIADHDSLSYEKRYRLAVVVLFLFYILNKK